jgi:hypothetical protein
LFYIRICSWIGISFFFFGFKIDFLFNQLTFGFFNYIKGVKKVSLGSYYNKYSTESFCVKEQHQKRLEALSEGTYKKGHLVI